MKYDHEIIPLQSINTVRIDIPRPLISSLECSRQLRAYEMTFIVRQVNSSIAEERDKG
jgi:hypothetical protein